jgi:Phage tail lysozyme
LTAGSRRKGSSKFGQADHDGNAGHDGNTGHDGNAGYYGNTGYDGNTVYEGDAGRAGHAGHAGRETEQGRNAGRYAGRHSNAQGKTTRRRVGKVVPAVAVAAVLAAGTATAYVLGAGGQPQTASLNEAMTAIGAHPSATSSAIGNASGSASTLIKVAKASVSSAARASAKHTARPAASHTPAASPSAAASSPAAQSGAATHDSATHHTATASAPATTQAAAPAVDAAANSSATSTSAASTTLSCNVGYGMLPDNVTAIVSFLVANGYSDNAAAGIAGNIYQESKGNPESVGSGGGGLIGWTPLRPGLITGNATADLQTQLSALLTYNQGWSQYLPALNAAASPAAAADIYVTDFERAGIPAASNREASAQNVATACGI